MLNPDGVYHGHYRADTLGQNLNRHYLGVSVWDAKPLRSATTRCRPAALSVCLYPGWPLFLGA